MPKSLVPRRGYKHSSARNDDMARAWKNAVARGEKPPTKAELDRWLVLMDAEKVSSQDFIEAVFKVKRQFDGDEFDAEEYEESYVPLDLRPAQEDMWETIQRQWAMNKPAKIINLKARQHGISTYGMALLAERVLRHVGDGIVICHDDDSTVVMFNKIREFIRQVPSWALPKQIKDQERAVRFEHANGKTSSIRLLTAGKKDTLGRSLSLDWIWISEFAFWPPAAKRGVGALMATLKKKRGSFAVFECTANGYDSFRRRYLRAVKGDGGYVARFYNWMMHPDYRLGFASSEARARFEETVGMEPRYGGAVEKIYVERDGATLEQLHFRRNIIDGDMEGDLDLWNQEYPTVPDDAFVSTGRAVFQIPTLKAWRHVAEEKEERARRVEFAESGGKVEALDSVGVRTATQWILYEEPIVGESYCFGADVAGGHEVHADGQTEADYSVCTIGHIKTGRIVARLRSHIFPTDFGWEILKGAAYFGMAMGYVERNQDGGEVLSFLEEAEIGDHEGAEIILHSVRLVRTDFGKAVQQDAGFKTTRTSKRGLIGQLKAFIQELGRGKLPGKGTKPEECPLDATTIAEAMAYRYIKPMAALSGIKKDNPASMGVQNGHDDTVIAMSLMLFARRELLPELPTLAKVKPKQTPQSAYFDMLMRMESSGQHDPGYVDAAMGTEF